VTEAQLPPPYDRLPRLIAEGASPAETNALRGALLANMLRFAKAASPFYRDRIPDALLSPGASAALWPTVRRLTKDELRANDAAIKVATTPPFAGAARESWTSGATGAPFNCRVSALADRMNGAVLARFYRWWDIDGAKDLLHITIDREGYRDRPPIETHQGWVEGDPRGKYHRLTVSTGLDAQLDRIAMLKPAYLKTFAVHLGALALRARERRMDIAFEAIMSGGVPLLADERRLAGEVFKCHVADIYGSEELGIIAVQCPRCEHYHPALETMHFEVLRDDGFSARTAESGRVVATSYLNFAMPLIRFEIGDRVELAQGVCPNGPIGLARIVGREKHMFTQPDGLRFLPYVSLEEVANLGPIDRFRFVQTGRATIEFRYTLSRAGEIDHARLQNVARKYLGAFDVVAVPMADADQVRSRKHLVFESLI
jgi:phenylacetate-CoA ligase